jgi:hypothetical protein
MTWEKPNLQKVVLEAIAYELASTPPTADVSATRCL